MSRSWVHTTSVFLLGLVLSISHIEAGFLAGTTVPTPHGNIPIENLQRNDTVYTRTISGDIVHATIRSHVSVQISEYIQICLSQDTVYTSFDQRFYVPEHNGWIQAQDLTIGNTIACLDGSHDVVTQVMRHEEPAISHEIAILHEHTYCVSPAAIWVHNPDVTVTILTITASGTSWFPGINAAALLTAVGYYLYQQAVKKVGKELGAEIHGDTRITVNDTTAQQPATPPQPAMPPEPAPQPPRTPDETNAPPQLLNSSKAPATPDEAGCRSVEPNYHGNFTCTESEQPEPCCHTTVTPIPKKETPCCGDAAFHFGKKNKGKEIEAVASSSDDDTLYPCTCPYACNCAPTCTCRQYGPYPKGRYEGAPYHHQNSKGRKSPAPTDGQKALNKSIPVYNKYGYFNGVRIALCNNEIVVFNETISGIYHGHVRCWTELTDDMQKALKKYNLIIERAGKGKINYDARCQYCCG